MTNVSETANHDNSMTIFTLQAIPGRSLGTQLDADTLTIAVALRIGAPLCKPHICRCGVNINTFDLYNLAFRFSAGRLARRVELNVVVKMILQTSGVPCLLGPSGLSRDDGRKPVGNTLFAYKHWKALCWDCTCVDTFSSTQVKIKWCVSWFNCKRRWDLRPGWNPLQIMV